MTSSSHPGETAERRGFLAPRPGAEPVDHCMRCGKQTAAGVSLCDEHNPRRLRGPSSTQMHATVFGGVALGVLAFFIIARLAMGTTGPFATVVTASTIGADGGVALAFAVTNEGESDGVADCRVTRDGVPRPDDFAFRTLSLPPGQAVSLERQLAPPAPGTAAYDPATISVICS